MENNLIRQSGRASLAQLMIGASAYCIKKYGRRRPKNIFVRRIFRDKKGPHLFFSQIPEHQPFSSTFEAKPIEVIEWSRHRLQKKTQKEKKKKTLSNVTDASLARGKRPRRLLYILGHSRRFLSVMCFCFFFFFPWCAISLRNVHPTGFFFSFLALTFESIRPPSRTLYKLIVGACDGFLLISMLRRHAANAAEITNGRLTSRRRRRSHPRYMSILYRPC